MKLPQTILIIDDEPGILEVLPRLLVNYFPQTKIITQAVFVEPLPPVDVILLDLFLKGAWEHTLASIHATKHFAPPIVCMTGKADSLHAMERSMASGAHDFISKERATTDPQTLAEKLTLAYHRHAAAKAT